MMREAPAALGLEGFDIGAVKQPLAARRAGCAEPSASFVAADGLCRDTEYQADVARR
jgi:hypothetical protein